MADGQPVEVTESNLEALTNQLEAPEQEFQTSTPEPTQTKTKEELPPSLSEQTAAQTGQAAQQTQEIPDFLKETPYKTPEELAKGYKNLQGEFTKTTQRIKPYEQFLERTEKDRNFANFIDQARLLYENPQLAAAYTPPQAAGADGRPNPNAYDLTTTEGWAKYQGDFENYVLRNADSRVNARLAQIENQTQLEQLKWQFKQKYPDANPDELLQWAQQNVPSMNRFEAALKLREFDNLKAKAIEEARKELNKQVETAQTAKTPTTAGTGQITAKATDILDYVNKNGTEKAFSKFSKAEVMKIIQEYS